MTDMTKQALLLTVGMMAVTPALAEKTGIINSLLGTNASKEVPVTRDQVNYSYAPLVKKVSPAVVSIAAIQVTQVRRNPFFDDPFFHFFMDGGAPRAQVERSLGSGVIVDPKGVIVTCAHVIQNSEAIQVRLQDNREFTANVVYIDPRNDLAIIKINGFDKEANLPFVDLGNSKNIEVGDIVFAIGNPFGVGQTVTNGIISGLARNIGGKVLIQTNAAINPGNSGGGLFDIQGSLIAIPNAILSKTGANHGIGFAIPVSVVRPLVEAVQSQGKVVRPWFGLVTDPITMGVASSLGLTKPQGVLVKEIHMASPAQSAGLKRSDVILAMNGKEINTVEEFQMMMQEQSVGDEVTFEVLRQGAKSVVKFNLIAPPEIPAPEETIISGNSPFVGMKVANISPALVVKHNFSQELQTGVVILEPSKNLLAFHLLPGDLIESVNGKPIENVKMLKELLEGKKRGINMVVRRGAQKLAINIQ